MGDLSYAMDLGNLHHYIVDSPMDLDDLKYLDNVMSRNRKMWGTKPVIATEMGMYIGDGYTFGANAIGEKIQADGF
jgi:hypothetical protein